MHENLKITRINIDSRHRNKEPKNIVKKFLSINDKIIFTINSSILRINMCLNHGFKSDDLIVISNIKPITITLRPNTLSLKKNFSFIYINHENHNLYNNAIIKISGILNSFINNIPVILLNNEYSIIIIDKNNYYFDIKILSSNDFLYNESYDINIYTFNGIHIKYINASYPLNNDIIQGFNTVIDSYSNYITIKLPVNAINNGFFNFNFLIGLIDTNIIGYPSSDYFRFYLDRQFNNIKKIKLLTTEIPYIETFITDLPLESKNNSFYFQILDDGDYIYKIDINTGKYDASSLQIELTKKINSLFRKFGTYLDPLLYYPYCISQISINTNTNLFSIQILSTYISSNNITINTEIYNDNFTRLNIIHYNHNLNINDTISISGVSNFNNIPDNIINTTLVIESILTYNSYIVKLPLYNLTHLSNPTNLTNQTYQITYPLQIRLLFTYNDTFGNIIGFNNIGSDFSYTNYHNIITNRTSYYNFSNLNSVGITNNFNPMLCFENISYLLMVSNIFSSNINYKDSSCVFAKLFIPHTEGDIIYNYFIQINEHLYSGINNLTYLEFNLLTPDGKQYYLNNKDYSYTIEIHEQVK